MNLLEPKEFLWRSFDRISDSILAGVDYCIDTKLKIYFICIFIMGEEGNFFFFCKLEYIPRLAAILYSSQVIKIH